MSNKFLDKEGLKALWDKAIELLCPSYTTFEKENTKADSLKLTVQYNDDSNYDNYGADTNKTVTYERTNTVEEESDGNYYIPDALFLVVNSEGTGYEWVPKGKVVCDNLDGAIELGVDDAQILDPSGGRTLFLMLYKPKGADSEPLLILGGKTGEHD